MERFCLGFYTIVPPFTRTDSVTADTGHDPPDPPLTLDEWEAIARAAKIEFLRVMRRRAEAKAADERRVREASRSVPRGALSERAELMLGLVREETEFTGEEVTRYFIPRSEPRVILYGRRVPFPGFRPSGAGDVQILRSLVRRGLIREVRGPMEFAHAVTREGIAAYDEIKKRRNALPEPAEEVDDE